MVSSWFTNAVVYHIFIDRFSGYNPAVDWKQPVFLGGNLKGIIAKADYISDLGCNTLWLSPINKTSAYHGYHITDFFQPDNRFGTLQDVMDLIRIMHAKNIRVLLDFVPNHCSLQHPVFQKALHDRKSPYRSWFYFNHRSNNYRTFLHFRELPKFNLDYPAARNHLLEAARYWLSIGFDGFRLDHAIGPSHDFWRAFCPLIRSCNPEAVLIGEVWLEGVRFRHLQTLGIRNKYLRWMKGIHARDVQLDYLGEFDGVLDFFLRHRLTEYIAWKETPESFLPVLKKKLERYYDRFPKGYYLPSFLDNHDMNRFLFDCGQQKEKLKTALQIQFNLPQPPILYYGTETALSHEEPVRWDHPYSDIHARKPMPWDNLDYKMIEFTKQLILEWKKRKQTSRHPLAYGKPI